MIIILRNMAHTVVAVNIHVQLRPSVAEPFGERHLLVIAVLMIDEALAVALLVSGEGAAPRCE